MCCTHTAANCPAGPAPRLHREDYFCRICGFNALSPFHLELHIMTYHPDQDD
ncbi:hypothetical protein H4R19_003678 [Coemansia spiralis]|nr:hypothetical protein H4R19_003678 [Coemansia spiralis]